MIPHNNSRSLLVQASKPAPPNRTAWDKQPFYVEMAPASPPSHHETCPNDLHVFHANAKSSPLARSHKVKRKPIPTATTHRAYRIVDTEESLSEYKNKDGEKDWPTKPQLLRKRTTRTYFVLCWDVLVTLLPVVFLGRSAVHVVLGLVTFHFVPSFSLFYTLQGLRMSTTFCSA